MEWLNDNAGAIQALGAIVLIAVTVALVSVTSKYVKVTSKIANASAEAADAARGSAESAAAQALSAQRLFEQAERARYESACPHVKAQRGIATNSTLKVRVSCDGPGTALGVEAQWIVGNQGSGAIPIAASLNPGEEVEKVFNLSGDEGLVVLQATKSHEGPLFRISYRDHLGGMYEAHTSTYDVRFVGLNETARLALGQETQA